MEKQNGSQRLGSSLEEIQNTQKYKREQPFKPQVSCIMPGTYHQRDTCVLIQSTHRVVLKVCCLLEDDRRRVGVGPRTGLSLKVRRPFEAVDFSLDLRSLSLPAYPSSAYAIHTLHAECTPSSPEGVPSLKFDPLRSFERSDLERRVDSFHK